MNHRILFDDISIQPPRQIGTPPGTILCAVLTGVFASYFIWFLFVTLTRGTPYPFGDFVALWSYAKITLSHSAALLYDFAGLHAAQVALGMNPTRNAPFPYPPQVVLMLIPLGLFSYNTALIVWLAGTFMLYAAAMLIGPRLAPALALATLLAPTTTITIVSGQSGFLTAALLIGGLRLVDRHPILSGVLFGLLTYKPQFGILVPFALIAAGQWRCIASACATAAVLVIITSAVLGWTIWLSWIEALPVYQEWFSQQAVGSTFTTTVLANMQTLGAPAMVAQLAQGSTAVLAVFTVWTCFCRGPRDLAIPLLLVCTCLATPHAIVYDLPMLTSAAVLFIAIRLKSGVIFTTFEYAVLILVLVFPAVMVNSRTQVPISAMVMILFLVILLQYRRYNVQSLTIVACIKYI